MTDTYILQSIANLFMTIATFFLSNWKTKLLGAWLLSGILYWLTSQPKLSTLDSWKEFFQLVFATLSFYWVVILILIGFLQVIK